MLAMARSKTALGHAFALWAVVTNPVPSAPTAPIRVAIDAKVTGVRYIEDRDTTDVVAGDKTREDTFIQRFILQLHDDPDTPWVLVAAGEMPRNLS